MSRTTYWPQRIKALYNGVRWGSQRGPAITIVPEPESITFHRMPDRSAARLMGWIMAGMAEKPLDPGMSEGGGTMGSHGGGGSSKGGGGGKHEGVEKDGKSTGGSKGGTPATTPKSPGR